MARVARYTVVKALTLLITVAAGLYLTILVVNLGGYVDEIFRSQITEAISAQIRTGWLRTVPEPERSEQIAAAQWAMEEAQGLHQPFLLRSVRWLVSAMTFDLGLGQAAGFTWWNPAPVHKMVLERLPYTLVLLGSANLLLFVGSVSAALALSGKHGELLDRLAALLQSLTSAPSWIHGVVLTIVLAGELQWLPYPKRYDILPPQMTLPLVLAMAKQMIMPALAILTSGFFQGLYAWRSYFLIGRYEDYVELAAAKGLSDRTIERQYILRPALPYVLTSFAVMMIGAWQGTIALEKVFLWPGVGNLFLAAVSALSTPLILAVVVVFAYMLAITVFLLDIVYALVDPRVRVGSGSPTLRPARRRLGWGRRRLSEPGKEPAPACSLARRVEAAASALPAVAADGTAKAALARGRRRPAWRSSTALPVLREVARQPAAVLGSLFVLVLLAASLYTVVAIPYEEAVADWRAQRGDGSRATWYRNPKNALPAWVNWFRRDKLPGTILMSSLEGGAGKEAGGMPVSSRRLGNLTVAGGAVQKEVGGFAEGSRPITLTFAFDYPFTEFPQEVVLYLEAEYGAKKPFAPLRLIAPDGRVLDLGTLSASSALNLHYLSQESRLQRSYGERTVIQGLFGDPAADQARSLQGIYQFVIEGLVFEEASDLDAELVVHGSVSGLAGTDAWRRDLMLPLLWGTPVALAFGLLAALGTTLFSMAVSALGVWYGGWVDGLVQRLTELNMILPVLPMAVLVFLMVSKTIWAILGIVVLLNIFGSSIKSYRAAFLQMRDAPYVEAAQTYGASNRRIILRYLVPRILPLMIPQIVLLIPAYVYYEATLAFLGVSDPYLPTWGKMIYDAMTSGVFAENYYWALEPIVLLALTSLAFAGVGFALDQVLNPRLRER